jgi:hypothetical protein
MDQPPKNTTGKPRKVPDDVREKQDPAYSKKDFDAALARVTRRLAGPSAPDPKSPKR